MQLAGLHTPFPVFPHGVEPPEIQTGGLNAVLFCCAEESKPERHFGAVFDGIRADGCESRPNGFKRHLSARPRHPGRKSPFCFTRRHRPGGGEPYAPGKAWATPRQGRAHRIPR
ncbi:hypothetical protein GCM10018987_17930 [Streptomyces cremeus]